MAVPKKKTSSKRKGLRRAGHTHKLYAHPVGQICPNCNSLTARHRICPACGHYREKEIVRIPAPSEEAEGEG